MILRDQCFFIATSLSASLVIYLTCHVKTSCPNKTKFLFLHLFDRLYKLVNKLMFHNLTETLININKKKRNLDQRECMNCKNKNYNFLQDVYVIGINRLNFVRFITQRSFILLRVNGTRSRRDKTRPGG